METLRGSQNGKGGHSNILGQYIKDKRLFAKTNYKHSKSSFCGEGDPLEPVRLPQIILTLRSGLVREGQCVLVLEVKGRQLKYIVFPHSQRQQMLELFLGKQSIEHRLVHLVLLGKLMVLTS